MYEKIKDILNYKDKIINVLKKYKYIKVGAT